MFRFSPLLFVVLALVSSHVAFGAPHNSQQADACITTCKHKHGLLGYSKPPPVDPSTVSHSTHHHSGTSPVPHPSPSPNTTKEPPASTSPAPTSTTPSPSPTPKTPSTSNSSASGSSSTSSDDISTYLSAHNTARAAHGASPLTWSTELAAKAQQWADGCVFKHSGGSLGPYGENLAAGTGDFSIDDAINSWTSEAPQYDPSNPQPSHFTQVVWKSTTQVGCAVQSCSGIFDASFGPANYYVCEYSPPGNVIGEFPQNVQV